MCALTSATLASATLATLAALAAAAAARAAALCGQHQHHPPSRAPARAAAPRRRE